MYKTHDKPREIKQKIFLRKPAVNSESNIKSHKLNLFITHKISSSNSYSYHHKNLNTLSIISTIKLSFQSTIRSKINITSHCLFCHYLLIFLSKYV